MVADTSSHDIDYVEYAGSCLTRGEISTTCVLLLWRNGIKCKYMFMFSLKKIVCKGLNLANITFVGDTGWDGGCPGCSVSWRACHSDDTEHFPSRWCVSQERNPGSTQAQGDHQHLQETQDTLADCFLDWSGSQGCWEGKGEKWGNPL